MNPTEQAKRAAILQTQQRPTPLPLVNRMGMPGSQRVSQFELSRRRDVAHTQQR